MTTNQQPTAKEQVLAWVRERNPQTMELKFGCRVEVIAGEELEIGSCFMVCMVEHGEITYVRDGMGKRYAARHLKILGSDMGIRELLRALNNLKDGCYAISSCGWIYSRKSLLDQYIPATDIPFDLTKNLHEQSDEFYQAILTLLK